MSHTPQIILTGYIIVPDDRLQAVRTALPAHIELTRAEDGCLAFDVVENPTQHGRFDVTERFVSRAAFDAHQKRMKSSPWAKVTDGIARHYEITEVPA